MNFPVSPLSRGNSSRPARRRTSVFINLILLLGLAGAGYLLYRHYNEAKRRTHAFDTIIWETANRHRISPYLVKAVIRQESNFRPWVTGNAGEIGLMQVTGGAVQDWERITGQQCPSPGLLYDPRLNIEIGSWYLAYALRRWHHHPDAEPLALAQYNAGIVNAMKWAAGPETENVTARIRFPATRKYIKNVLSYRQYYEVNDPRE